MLSTWADLRRSHVAGLAGCIRPDANAIGATPDAEWPLEANLTGRTVSKAHIHGTPRRLLFAVSRRAAMRNARYAIRDTRHRLTGTLVTPHCPTPPAATARGRPLRPASSRVSASDT